MIVAHQFRRYLGTRRRIGWGGTHGRHTGGRIGPLARRWRSLVPTDEELLIACDTADVIAGGLAGSRQRPRRTS